MFAEPEKQNCLALLALTSLLWCTEALPLYVTSMLVTTPHAATSWLLHIGAPLHECDKHWGMRPLSPPCCPRWLGCGAA